MNRKIRANAILTILAEKHHTTPENVRLEISKAIDYSQSHNVNSAEHYEIRRLINALGRKPTVDEMLLHMVGIGRKQANSMRIH